MKLREGSRDASKTTKVVAGIIVATLGAVASILSIIAFIRSNDAPDKFEGQITRPEAAKNFVDFAKANDGKIVYLNVECIYSEEGSCAQNQDPISKDPVLEVYTGSRCELGQGCKGGNWFRIHYDPNTSDASVSNGPYGAGSLVIKGYFSASLRGVLGANPQEIINFQLNAVDRKDVPS